MVEKRIHTLNPKAQIFYISAKKDEGFESWINYLKEKIERMGGKIVPKVRVIEVHENVFNANNLAADELRERLSEKKVTMLNVMSSPGSENNPSFRCHQ